MASRPGPRTLRRIGNYKELDSSLSISLTQLSSLSLDGKQRGGVPHRDHLKHSFDYGFSLSKSSRKGNSVKKEKCSHKSKKKASPKKVSPMHRHYSSSEDDRAILINSSSSSSSSYSSASTSSSSSSSSSSFTSHNRHSRKKKLRRCRCKGKRGRKGKKGSDSITSVSPFGRDELTGDLGMVFGTNISNPKVGKALCPPHTCTPPTIRA